MIDNLNDINRVLLALETLGFGRARTPRRLLLRYLNGEVIYGQNPLFDPIFEYLKVTEVISERPTGFGLTGLGRDILAKNIGKSYEIQNLQRPLILRRCYLDGPFRSQTKRLLKKFIPDPNTDKLTWSELDSEPLEDVEWVNIHLVQLGIVERAQHLYSVNPEFNDVLSGFQSESSDFTEAQFRTVLREKKLLGEMAEKFVLQWEKKRLKNQGNRTESLCVKRISKKRINAGYDIESFNGTAKFLEHDRFIEVKGSGDPKVRFVWTQNEMMKAAELGNKYWIYFVGGIERRRKRMTREPVTLCDPNANLNMSSGFNVRAKGDVLVTAGISGALLDAQNF